MVTSTPLVPAVDFETLTGWELKPEGACRGVVCIPLRQPAGPEIDLRELAPALAMPLVRDREAGLWALGPPAGPALADAEAPDFTLPERRGGELTLSSLRGRKVAIVAWAPW